MTDVFISYARVNRDSAQAVAAGLSAAGLDVWWDRELTGGGDFASEIEQHLGSAPVCLVLWSGASIKSDFVRDESSRARDVNKLLPVRIEAVPLPLGFGTLHTLDLLDWDGDPDDDAFLALLAQVRQRVAAGRAGAPPDAIPRRTTVPAAEDTLDPLARRRLRRRWLMGLGALGLVAGSGGAWTAWRAARQREALQHLNQALTYHFNESNGQNKAQVEYRLATELDPTLAEAHYYWAHLLVADMSRSAPPFEVGELEGLRQDAARQFEQAVAHADTLGGSRLAVARAQLALLTQPEPVAVAREDGSPVAVAAAEMPAAAPPEALPASTEGPGAQAPAAPAEGASAGTPPGASPAPQPAPAPLPGAATGASPPAAAAPETGDGRGAAMSTRPPRITGTRPELRPEAVRPVPTAPVGANPARPPAAVPAAAPPPAPTPSPAPAPAAAPAPAPAPAPTATATATASIRLPRLPMQADRESAVRQLAQGLFAPSRDGRLAASSALSLDPALGADALPFALAQLTAALALPPDDAIRAGASATLALLARSTPAVLRGNQPAILRLQGALTAHPGVAPEGAAARLVDALGRAFNAARPVVYLQIADARQMPLARRLAATMSAAGYQTPGIETTGVAKAPRRPELRSHGGSDPGLARWCLSQLSSATGLPATWSPLRSVRPANDTFEVWFDPGLCLPGGRAVEGCASG